MLEEEEEEEEAVAVKSARSEVVCRKVTAEAEEEEEDVVVVGVDGDEEPQRLISCCSCCCRSRGCSSPLPSVLVGSVAAAVARRTLGMDEMGEGGRSSVSWTDAGSWGRVGRCGFGDAG